MLNVLEYRREFIASCPYCDSRIKIKAGRKLKFKDYNFTLLDDPFHKVKYLKIPTWKCKICKNKFAVDMEDKGTCTLEDLPKSTVADKYYVVEGITDGN